MVSTKPLLEQLEELIPADELASADEFFASMPQAGEQATSWRRENYIRWRTGWNPVACRQDEDRKRSHNEALANVATHCACLHRWEQTGQSETRNVWLGTYQRRARFMCVRCGAEDVRVTAENNYSGC